MRSVDSVLKLPLHQKLDLESLDLRLKNIHMVIEWPPAENYYVVFPTSFGQFQGKYVFASKTHNSRASTPSTAY